MGTQAASFGFAPLLQLAHVRRDWQIIVTVSALVTAIGVLGFTYIQALSKPGPLSLSVHESAGQLIIEWASAAAPEGARLEIDDGPHHTALLVASPLSDITYAPRTADVQVKLTRFDEGSQPEIARFVVRELSPAELNAQFVALLAQARSLREMVQRQTRQVSHLWEAAEDLENEIPQHIRPARGAPARAVARPEVRWWR